MMAAESGAYIYLLNGQPTDVEERWSLTLLGEGRSRINSSRRAPGILIEVDADTRHGLVEGCQLVWQGDGQQIQTSYRLAENVLLVDRCVGDGEKQITEVPFAQSSEPLLFPLMRIFTGPLIARILEQGGQASVAVPFIGDPSAMDQLLLPRISQRCARLLEQRHVLEKDGKRWECRVCEYTGDQYAPGTLFYLDREDRLLRYRWQQEEGQDWDVWLMPE
jgi:hypothetical protein